MWLFGIEKLKIQSIKYKSPFNTETMLPISEIHGDTMILKDGGYRTIIKVTWLNLDLKSEDEQLRIFEWYKRFLNSLNFPVQILVRNSFLELSSYIDYVDESLKKTDNDQVQSAGGEYLAFLNQINLSQWLLYIKEFYIIVPFYTVDETNRIKRPWWKKFIDAFAGFDSAEKIVARYRLFVKQKQELDTRTTLVMEGLKWIGIQSTRLALSDIVALLFRCYNPTSRKDQSTFETGEI
jgi:hypothetical protein